MPYYEVVYETGNHSVAFYDSDEEAQAALQAHQDKAKTGESATPESQPRTDLAAGEVPGATSWPAERVSKVYKYDNHPADFGVGNAISAATLGENLNAMRDESGNVDVGEAAAMVRNASSPFAQPESPHDSDYAMEHTELAWAND